LGADALAQMLNLQLEQADASVLIVERGIANNAMEDVRREAHRLKGSSLMLGFMRLGALYTWLEDEAERHTQTEREHVVEQLKTACADVRRWVETESHTQTR
jgi:HPt (histidine-containing phosphotransfer) domain-containing protein